jgi:hypothetical protein
MKRYKIKIGYIVKFEINAENKEEAEELAWFEFDQSQPHEPEIDIKEIK